LTKRIYKYVPDIDWANEKSKTDIGIMELVGVNSEDINKFNEYVKEYAAKL